MKRRFILYRRKLGGTFYSEDTQTKKQESLGTKDRAEATSLLNARNEAVRQPQLNLLIAKAYLAGTDSGVSTRTWQDAFNAIIENKHGPRLCFFVRPTRAMVLAEAGNWIRERHRLVLVPDVIQMIAGSLAKLPLAQQPDFSPKRSYWSQPHCSRRHPTTAHFPKSDSCS